MFLPRQQQIRFRIDEALADQHAGAADFINNE
jgi:hypothetical protein